MKTVIDWKQPWGVEKILEVAKSLLPEDIVCPSNTKVNGVVGEVIVGEVPDLARRLSSLVDGLRETIRQLAPIYWASDFRESPSHTERTALGDVFGEPLFHVEVQLGRVQEAALEMMWTEIHAHLFRKYREEMDHLAIRADWAVASVPKREGAAVYLGTIVFP